MSSNEGVAAALARLYDLDLVEDPGDLDLYLALAARSGGPVLELAAGSGRIAVPLAAAGHAVVAVDRDPAMLARAGARRTAAGAETAARLRLVEADVVGLALEEGPGFRLAILALNSLMLFPDRPAQRAAIAALARHLAPGGLAVVDVWLPDGLTLARYDGRLVLEYLRRDPESGRDVAKTAAAFHDPASGSVDLVTLYDEAVAGAAPVRWTRRDRLRLVGADELRALAEESGLRVETLAGGYDLAPLGPGDERAVLIAARPPGQPAGRARWPRPESPP